MNTTDNNKLLAEFMDFEWYAKDEELEYHTNWNWLMQVVEKIESLGCRVEIINSTCKIEPIITHSEYITKIEAVYNACVEFVKWYNQTK